MVKSRVSLHASRRAARKPPDPHDPRHRRRRLHRRQFRARLARGTTTSRSSISTSSPTPAISATSRRSTAIARHVFVRGDIGDRALVDALLAQHRPRAIVNFAAESHVDRSIHGPAAFIETNVVGTFTLLEAARAWWSALPRAPSARRSASSTSRPTRSTARSRPTIRAFTETTPYAPNSPYSASKAASDHLVRAYHHTYGLPTLTTNCSNNYGPYQFPEKLIPLMIVNALAGKPLPVYGDGRQRARLALRRRPLRGDSRGARARRAGRDLQRRRQRRDDATSTSSARSARCSPSCVPGRDYASADHVRRRTAPATTAATRSTPPRSARELGWTPARDVRDRACAGRSQWYLDNATWLASVTSGDYQKWISLNYTPHARVTRRTAR